MNNNSVYAKLPALFRDHIPCVLATVIETTGSTPQVPGSSAIIGKSGLLAGTVGGGPAEYQVVCKALAAIESGTSEIVTFRMDGNLPDGSDSICGGHMSVLIDASPGNHFSAFENLTGARIHHTSGILITSVEIKNDNTLKINRIWFEHDKPQNFSDDHGKLLAPYLREMSAQPAVAGYRKVAFPERPSGQVFFACLEAILPPPSLVIAGAGHVGKALARMGNFLGFEVTIWDDRSEYANVVNIPEADFHFNGNLDDFTSLIDINQNSYLVIVTRGHKFDAEVLGKWIKTKPAYLGMMGSRTKVAQMRQQFLEKGWATTEEWDNIHTPIGLKINAKTVEEIAVSIAAELVQVRNAIHSHS